jgi:AcrR family transcriptional regulator
MNEYSMKYCVEGDIVTIREDQKEKRRQEILFAGLDLFVHKGYSGTTIKDIAGAVGMSAGLMFHYFASKEELFLELIKLGIEGPMNSLQPAGMAPLEFFEYTAQQVLAIIRSEPFVAKMFVLMNQTYYSSDIPASVKQLLTGFDVYTPTAAIIQQGQENGTIRSGDPVALAIAFWGAIQGIAETIAMYPQMPCPQSDWVVDILRTH